MKRKPLTDQQRRGQEILGFTDLPLFGLHYSRGHIYKLIKAGEFPPLVRIGGNRVGFARESIVGHVATIKRRVGGCRREVGRKLG